MKKNGIYIFVFLIIFCSFGAKGQDMASQGPVTNDKKFFEEYLNLDYPGLEEVKMAVAENDYPQARASYIRYLKTRTMPRWFFDWHDYNNPTVRKDKYDTSYADHVARNILTSVGISHDFGSNIDWKLNPTKPYNREWMCQLNRHWFWTKLGDAYWATGDEKYAQAFVRQIKDWIQKNPRQAKDYNADTSTWRKIECGIRMLGNWPNCFYRFIGSPSFDDETMLMMVKSFHEHGEHLYNKPTNQGNWLVLEMNGLYHVAVLFPEFKESSVWEKFSAEKLFEEQRRQFYPDGAQKELAPGYHGLALDNIQAIYPLAKLNDRQLPNGFVRGLENLYTYFLKIMMPDGTLPALNDTRWSIDVRPYLVKGYSYFPKHEDFLYASTKGEQGESPLFTSVWMPWAGWYIMRSGWDSNALYSAFDVGPYSISHSHEDKLSFVLYGYGNRILTEGGQYTYDESEMRKYIISSRAHNNVRVDGKEQNRVKLRKREYVAENKVPMKNLWISNKIFDYGEGWYDEGFGDECDTTVKQSRSLLFIKNLGWLMFDVFSPTDVKAHTYESFFHLTSMVADLDSISCVVVSKETDKATLMIIPLKQKELSAEVVSGQETPEYQGWEHITDYKVRPVATTTYKRQAKGEWVEPYLFIPNRPGAKTPTATVKKTGENRFVIILSNGKSLNVSYATRKGRIYKLEYLLNDKLEKSRKITVL